VRSFSLVSSCPSLIEHCSWQTYLSKVFCFPFWQTAYQTIKFRLYPAKYLGISIWNSLFTLSDAYSTACNRFVGGVLGSFWIDLMGFWTIEFFSPSNFGGGCWGWFSFMTHEIGTEISLWKGVLQYYKFVANMREVANLGFTPGRVPLLETFRLD